MIYNLCFLISSLVFLLIILYFFLEDRALCLRNNSSFLLLIISGIVDLCIDIPLTVIIGIPSPGFRTAVLALASLLCFCQVLTYYFFLWHISSYYPNAETSARLLKKLVIIPAAALVLLIWNIGSGEIFAVDEAGRYFRGPDFPILFIIDGLMLAVAVITGAVFHRDIGRSKVVVLSYTALINAVGILVQACNFDYHVSNLGVALGIVLLYFVLNNPYHFMDNLTSAFDLKFFRDCCRNFTENHESFHLLSVELSQLRRINLVSGTDAGNRLLKACADMLRDNDKRRLVFRVTGKRFVVINTTMEQQNELKKRALSFFSKPIELEGESVKSPAIICEILNADEKDSNALLAYVGYLISTAPGNNETCIVSGSPETLEGFRRSQEIERYLDTAIEQELFTVVFQPIYSIKRERYTSLEVLSRLNHPVLGPISPDLFISLAEKNGQIGRLDLLQIKRVCAFVAANPQLMSLVDNIKFNLSPAELIKEGHLEQIFDVIKSFSLPLSFFQFEITEQLAFEYDEFMRSLSNRCTQTGIGLCLDDFGSGYANVNSVLKLPFTVIKLDRSLINDIYHNRESASLYRGIISTLNEMGFQVVAEGVENAEEVRLLEGWGVDYIQGYYFSRPISGEKVLELLGNSYNADVSSDSGNKIEAL
ncbi:MAG: EAL domain-containing protein [Candidatus Limivicinus sp.]|jgi:EAL domain-containing protein (putative c-di-GMP-specific phosphodiesterase class I)/GGDEF domain-containing protein